MPPDAALRAVDYGGPRRLISATRIWFAVFFRMGRFDSGTQRIPPACTPSFVCAQTFSPKETAVWQTASGLPHPDVEAGAFRFVSA